MTTGMPLSSVVVLLNVFHFIEWREVMSQSLYQIKAKPYNVLRPLNRLPMKSMSLPASISPIIIIIIIIRIFFINKLTNATMCTITEIHRITDAILVHTS